MTDPFDVLPAEARQLLVPAPTPDWIDPMLATLTERRFSDPGWIFERKLDGERCLSFRTGGDVRMLSRNRLDIGPHYPEVAEALASQTLADFVLDGEVVAFKGKNTSFELLQRRMHVWDPEVARRTGVRVFYYVFDLMHANGYDTTRLPLRHRKALLRTLFRFDGPLRFTIHRNSDGEAYWEQACRKGWEGVIAKRADSPYVPRRSSDWLKFKCVNEQELVIGGYTEPKGSRTGFGALLVGHYEGGELRYAGKVGTGFDERLLGELASKLAALERDTPPFAAAHLPRKGVHWVEPKLVAQIGFSEWTRDGRLRHPRFVGLREDKPATEVVRERPRP
jgi:DNA ligase D-like protein (predicted ligase)